MKPLLIKTALVIFMSALFIMNMIILNEVFKDRAYLYEQVATGKAVQEVNGTIKTAKSFYAGRSHNNIKIHVTGLKKWIYFNGVTKAEKKALKEGNHISVEAYPRRPNTKLIDNEYYQNTVLLSLGYSVDNQEIVTTTSKFQKKIRDNWLFIILFLMTQLLTLCGGLALLFLPAEHKKDAHNSGHP